MKKASRRNEGDSMKVIAKKKRESTLSPLTKKKKNGY